MSRIITLGYGITCYIAFFCTFLYLIGFSGNIAVPKGVDDGAIIAWPLAIAINLGLIVLFGLQHGIMARPGFKRAWTRLVPASAERSTYVLFSSLALMLMFALWQPLPATVWTAEAGWLRALLWAGFFIGWSTVLYTSFLIDHFDLFGLRQVWERFRGTQRVETDFTTPSLYRWVRHPMMTGFLLAFWSIPVMSIGHLLLAIGMTAYIIAGTMLEERDLIAAFGERYRRYRTNVPRFIPVPGRSAAETGTERRDTPPTP